MYYNKNWTKKLIWNKLQLSSIFGKRNLKNVFSLPVYTEPYKKKREEKKIKELLFFLICSDKVQDYFLWVAVQ